MRHVLAIGLVLGGCTRVLGIEDLRIGGDAPPDPDAASDAPIDAPPTGQRTIRGTTTRTTGGNTTPAGGVQLTYLAPPGDIVMGTATSASDGTYTLAAPAGIDGVVRAAGDATLNLLDTYVYAGPLATDLTVDILNTTAPVIQQLGSNAGLPQTSGLAIAYVRSADHQPVQGASVVQPFALPHFYTGPLGIPMAGTTATAPDGIIWVFNPGPNTYTLEASMPGVMYGPRSFQPRISLGVTALSILVLPTK